MEGRFVGADPLSFAAGDVNLYRYVGNSPALYTDPSGYKRALIIQTIRKWIKMSVSGEDIFGEVIEKGLGIPVTPSAVFFAIMSPTNAECPAPNFPININDGLTHSERLDLVFYLKTGFYPPDELIIKMKKHANSKKVSDYAQRQL